MGAAPKKLTDIRIKFVFNTRYYILGYSLAVGASFRELPLAFSLPAEDATLAVCFFWSKFTFSSIAHYLFLVL